MIIRTKDIWKVKKELETLKQKAKTLQELINSGDKHSEFMTRRRNLILSLIKEKETTLKVLKGEAEHIAKKPWEKNRPEQRLEAFLGVV